MIPLVGAVTVSALQLAIAPRDNAAELPPRVVAAAERLSGAIETTRAVLGRIDGERGNLVSVIA